MDPRLLDFYRQELQFIREMGQEFAEAYPNLAGRLSLREFPCPDPYVERLLEAFAFLTARVQLKLQARYPEFTHQLLEAVYPGFLAPVPSMGIVEFKPDRAESSLLSGVKIPRGSELRTVAAKNERTVCQFRTAHDVELWPLELREARYLSGSSALGSLNLAGGPPARAALRLRLVAPEGVSIAQLPLDALTLFLGGPPDIATQIIEQSIGEGCGVVVRGTRATATATLLPARCIEQVGLDDDQALLPVPVSGFQGYRLLQEYFALPARLRFVRIGGMRPALAAVTGTELELLLLFSRAQPKLENVVDASHFGLYVTPVVNLFEREVDRIHYRGTELEQPVVVDRNRPMDFEVHSIQRVRGIGAGGEITGELWPLYRLSHRTAVGPDHGFYTVIRRPRTYSQLQRQTGARTRHIGSEVNLSVVDAAQRPHRGALRQLDLRALCTNRDLPAQLQIGAGRTDFVLEGGAPVESIRCLAGPTRPRVSPAFSEVHWSTGAEASNPATQRERAGAAWRGDDGAWRLISHLSLNHLSIGDGKPQRATAMLKEMLALYVDPNDVTGAKQLEGIRQVDCQPVIRRIPVRGPIAYGRGMAIAVEVDDADFEGTGAILLGAVLERFFARYASINSFTELSLRSSTRGEVKRWPPRSGTRQVI